MACDSVSYIAEHKVGTIRLPQNGENMSPWVKVWFDDGSEDSPTVTVGNKSCPSACNQPHSAVIKSFEFGYTDGFHCTVEILDEEGGSLENIANKLNKCIKNSSRDYKMNVKWGWVVANCMETTSSNVISSPTLTLLPMNIEIHYSKGAIRYTITAVDLLQAVFASRKTITEGTELHRKKLSDALRDLFEDEEPKITFQKARRSGKQMLFGDNAYKWKDADEVGSSWTADGQNKLSTALKWTENFRTEHDKGTVPFWKSGSQDPTVCFLEGLGCDTSEGEMKDRSVGTFIVNGGSCSNVIDFTPKINWVAAFAQMSTGGQAATPISGEITKRENKKPGCDKIGNEDTGLLTSADSTRQLKEIKGYKKTTEYAIENQDLNDNAGSVSAGIQPIEAELRIRGDPSPEFCVFEDAVQRTCAIVAINPWHLRQQGSNKCPSWLVSPPCNPVLTNKFWWIFGYNHQIKEGSYVTTLKLRLDAPGIDINPGEAPGKDSSIINWAGDTC